MIRATAPKLDHRAEERHEAFGRLGARAQWWWAGLEWGGKGSYPLHHAHQAFADAEAVEHRPQADAGCSHDAIHRHL